RRTLRTQPVEERLRAPPLRAAGATVSRSLRSLGGRRQHRLKRRRDRSNLLDLRRDIDEWAAVSRLEHLVEVGRVESPLGELRLREQPREKRQRGPDAGDEVLAERTAHARDGKRA